MLHCNIFMAMQHKSLTTYKRFVKSSESFLSKRRARLCLLCSLFVLTNGADDGRRHMLGWLSNCAVKAVRSSKLLFRMDELVRQLSKAGAVSAAQGRSRNGERSPQEHFTLRQGFMLIREHQKNNGSARCLVPAFAGAD
jgi:hypothetical protein